MTSSKTAIANCTHPVPDNSYGIVAMHSFDNEPIEPNELKPIFDGPIRSAQPAIAAELAKVEVLEPGMRS